MTLYTLADLARHCEVEITAMTQRYRRNTLPEPVAFTAGGRPLWSTTQADELQRTEYKKRIDITGCGLLD